MTYRSRKYLAAAKGQPCTLQIPGVCIGGTETTVACHSPLGEDRNGTKAPDFCVADGCSACHDYIDRRMHIKGSGLITEEDQRFYFHRGMVRTLANRLERGILI